MAETSECCSPRGSSTLISPKVAEQTVLESKWSDSSSVKTQVASCRV